MAALNLFTIGIEEEFQLVDLETRELRSGAADVLPSARLDMGEEVQPELHQSHIEAVSPVCNSLAEVRQHLEHSRSTLQAAAAENGCGLAAAGTHPFSHWQDQKITPKARYRGITRDFAQVARENVIFGCHVHVGVQNPEIALQVMNHARIWLSPLLALTANSPFWLADDTGYDSFRTELWWRWPLAGPPPYFAGQESYHSFVKALIETGSVEDVSKIYWDIRLPQKVATVEFRVCDAGLTIDDGVMIAGLVRALVVTCHQQVLAGKPAPMVRSQLLKAAQWRAARHGLGDSLIDPVACRAVPARQMVDSLLASIQPALRETGDWEEVASLVEQVLANGNGASRQRAALAATGTMEGVVDFLRSQLITGRQLS